MSRIPCFQLVSKGANGIEGQPALDRELRDKTQCWGCKLSGFYEGHALPALEGDTVKATLKWFNPVKGFGFVTPEDGQGDAFLHVSVLSQAGMEQLADGTSIMCQIGPGAKGRQVIRILDILGIDPNFTPQQGGGFGGGHGGGHGGGFGGGHGGGHGGGRRDYAPRDSGHYESSGPETETTATVKWFKPDKGFGFLAGDDGGKDIFVHKSLLRRCDVMILDTGMKVECRCRESDKGREATWIRVINE